MGASLCPMSNMTSTVHIIIILSVYVLCCTAMESFEQKEKFKVKQGKVTKWSTCTYKLKFDYPGTVYTNSSSKVTCKVAGWPKSAAINFVKTLSFFIGNFTANVKIKITKVKNKVTQKTSLETAVTKTVENKTSPWDLWCPEENTIVWGDLGDPLIANTSIVSPLDSDSYKECAKRCSEFENEAGNKPCFSWTLNSNSFTLLDLESGACRLYGYKDVYRLVARGVQSGYHKCYPAMVDLGMVELRSK